MAFAFRAPLNKVIAQLKKINIGFFWFEVIQIRFKSRADQISVYRRSISLAETKKVQFFQELTFNFITAGLQDLGAGTETARLTRSLTNTLPKLRSLQFVESSSERLTKIKVIKKNRDLRMFIFTLSILCICFSRYASHRCPRWSARLSRSLESVWTVAMETAGAASNRPSKVWLPYISFALLDDFEKRTWHQERSRAERTIRW